MVSIASDTFHPPLLLMASGRLRASTDCEWPNWQLPGAARGSRVRLRLSGTLPNIGRGSGRVGEWAGRWGSAHLNVRLFGVEVQRRAAGLHPAQPHVLHQLYTPVLLLLAVLQTLLGHGFVLHDGRSWQETQPRRYRAE